MDGTVSSVSHSAWFAGWRGTDQSELTVRHQPNTVRMSDSRERLMTWLETTSIRKIQICGSTCSSGRRLTGSNLLENSYPVYKHPGNFFFSEGTGQKKTLTHHADKGLDSFTHGSISQSEQSHYYVCVYILLMIESYCTRDSDSGADISVYAPLLVIKSRLLFLFCFLIAMYSNIWTNHPLVTIENYTGKTCATPQEYFNNY